jgi:hypothetical protein
MEELLDTTKALQQGLEVTYFECINGDCGKNVNPPTKVSMSS